MTSGRTPIPTPLFAHFGNFQLPEDSTSRVGPQKHNPRTVRRRFLDILLCYSFQNHSSANQRCFSIGNVSTGSPAERTQSQVFSKSSKLQRPCARSIGQSHREGTISRNKPDNKATSFIITFNRISPREHSLESSANQQSISLQDQVYWAVPPRRRHDTRKPRNTGGLWEMMRSTSVI